MDIPRTPEEFSQLKKLCVEKIYTLYDKARKELNLRINDPKVEFSLHGKVAGKAYYELNKIALNEHFLFHNPDDFLETVATHEVSHNIAFLRHGRQIKPHGTEWSHTMNFYGIMFPKTCHNYSMENLPKYAAAIQKRKQLIKNTFSGNPVRTIPNGKIITFD